MVVNIADFTHEKWDMGAKSQGSQTSGHDLEQLDKKSSKLEDAGGVPFDEVEDLNWDIGQAPPEEITFHPTPDTIYLPERSCNLSRDSIGTSEVLAQQPYCNGSAWSSYIDTEIDHIIQQRNAEEDCFSPYDEVESSAKAQEGPKKKKKKKRKKRKKTKQEKAMRREKMKNRLLNQHEKLATLEEEKRRTPWCSQSLRRENDGEMMNNGSYTHTQQCRSTSKPSAGEGLAGESHIRIKASTEGDLDQPYPLHLPRPILKKGRPSEYVTIEKYDSFDSGESDYTDSYITYDDSRSYYPQYETLWDDLRCPDVHEAANACQTAQVDCLGSDLCCWLSSSLGKQELLEDPVPGEFPAEDEDDTKQSYPQGHPYLCGTGTESLGETDTELFLDVESMLKSQPEEKAIYEKRTGPSRTGFWQATRDTLLGWMESSLFGPESSSTTTSTLTDTDTDAGSEPSI